MAKKKGDAAAEGREECDGRWHDRMHKNDTYRRRLWKRRIAVDFARCKESMSAHIAERERVQRQLARQLGDNVTTPGGKARRAPSILAAAAAPYDGGAAAAAEDAVFEEDSVDVLAGEDGSGSGGDSAFRVEEIAAGVARRAGLFDSEVLEVDAEGEFARSLYVPLLHAYPANNFLTCSPSNYRRAVRGARQRWKARLADAQSAPQRWRSLCGALEL